jgi:hypothetical protein
MKVSPELILPSQDFLKPRTVTFILECFVKGQLDELPPHPIVRKDDAGNLIAIDGHNLIAVKLKRGEDIEVHLATSPDDGLEPTSEANIQRNKDLKEKYESVIAEAKALQAKGIHSFNDLIGRYPELF